MIHLQLSILIVAGTVSFVGLLGNNLALAQTTNSTPVTDFVNSANKAPVMHVVVRYESPKTIILQLQDESPSYFEEFGHAIDFAKEQGYSIESTSTFTDAHFDLDYYTVFMAKK